MSDIVITGAILCVAFLLLTQLVVLNSMRKLRVAIYTLVEKIEIRQNQSLVAHFETEQEAQSRRYKFRAKLSLEGRLTVQGQKQNVKVVDISETGALVQTEGHSLVSGELHPFSIRLGEETIDTNARVIRHLGENEYGISFQDLKLSAKQRIRDQIKQNAQDELASDISPIVSS